MLQTTDWGSVLWLDENKEIVSIEGISVGIVSLLPGCARHAISIMMNRSFM